MKELSIEEKAKAYDEAILRMSRAFNDNRCSIGFMNEIFPELKESDDEKIRKGLLKYLKDMCKNMSTPFSLDSAKLWIAWLEKQGKGNPLKGTLGDVFDDLQFGLDPSPKQDEKKPVEWSEEDEERINSCIKTIHNSYYSNGKDIVFLESLKERLQPQPNVKWSKEDDEKFETIMLELRHCKREDTNVKSGFYEELINWLKSLKDRVQPQIKQEWGEEDEDVINLILSICSDFKNTFCGHVGAAVEDDIKKIDKWLKSLRQNLSNVERNGKNWKPSDEQMTALRRMKAAVGGEGEIYEPLNSLYDGLKKLM